jgi:putative ABC transport system permease protein
VAGFYSELLARLRRLPGIADASMASALPITGADLEVDLGVTPEGAPAAAGDHAHEPSVRHVLVGGRFFQTMGMKILRGRDFGPEDGSGMNAVIVNQTAARRLWPGREALGRRLRLVQTEAPFAVVGVVADATYAGLEEAAVPVVYLDHAQSRRSFVGELLAPQMTLLVRTSGAPRWAISAVRQTVRELDPRLPVFRTTTLADALRSTVGVERQAAALYSGLGMVAVALAMLGLYGVLMRTIGERRREIGVRMACGASPARVRALVLRRSGLLACCGAAAGLALGVPAGRLIASLLYGVRPYDPATWLGATLALMMAALLVSARPAGLAGRINPVEAMKPE